MLSERYYAVDCGLHAQRTLVWNVRRQFEGCDNVSYVVLERADDPTIRKTLAVSVLGDRRRYQAA
ncbi:MAG TPA: hypothetical protein VM689_23445 [Aliidongia sp.]|nr:hypothetical protein [Aliidongia sp.]